MMDTRAIFRMDMGFYVRIMLWALLENPCPLGLRGILTIAHIGLDRILAKSTVNAYRANSLSLPEVCRFC